MVMARRETVHSVRAIEPGKGVERRYRGGALVVEGFGVRLRGGMGIAHRLPDTKFIFCDNLRDSLVACLISS